MDLIINVLKIGRVMDAIGISKSVKYMYVHLHYTYMCAKKSTTYGHTIWGVSDNSARGQVGPYVKTTRTI